MPDSVRIAQTFAQNMFAQEYAKAVEAFDPTLRTALSDQVLSQLNAQITQLFGKPTKLSSSRVARTMAAGTEIVYLAWDFEKERVELRLVITNANHIAGVSIEIPVTR